MRASDDVRGQHGARRAARGAAFAALVACAACASAQRGGRSEEDAVAGGGRITVVGVARDAKLGALVETDRGATFWIAGLDSWPAEFSGKRVRVRGRAAEASDLPAFVRVPGEPEKSGIAVSSPAELAAARRRTVIHDARWELAGE